MPCCGPPDRVVRVWQQHQVLHLTYPDMVGRAVLYMIAGSLPASFLAGQWGPGFTREAILDIFAQAMDLPPHVPDGWEAFHPRFLTSKCMVVRRVSRAGPGRARCEPTDK